MAGQSNPGGGMFSQVLGPDYDYSAQILPPDKIGMSADGTMNALADDIGGLMAYVKVLVTGTGKATKTPGPLGSKFFIGTSAQCTDKVSGDNVGRSIYVNNVPDGSIPIMSSGGGGVTFDTFKGLVPGLMSNLAQINPMQILSAFTDGSSPTCQAITMETIDAENKRSSATAFITNSDIRAMPNSWFTLGPRPITTDSSGNEEAFTTMQESSSLINDYNINHSINYGKMPNDFFIKLYYTSLGLVGLYIFLKIMLRKRLA